MRATWPDLALSQVFPSFLFFSWTHHFFFVCSSQIHFPNYSGQGFIIILRLLLSLPFVSHSASTFTSLPTGKRPDPPTPTAMAHRALSASKVPKTRSIGGAVGIPAGLTGRFTSTTLLLSSDLMT